MPQSHFKRLTSPKRFITAITDAGLRREFREKAKDAHNAQLKAALPGKLKDEKVWEDWLTGLHIWTLTQAIVIVSTV